MNTEQDLIIPAKVLDQARMSAGEMIIELAAYLYAQKRLTMGQARRMAGLDQLAFQHELAKRDIYIHYDWVDVETDLKNLGIEL